MLVSHLGDKSSGLQFVYLPADNLMTTLGFPGGSTGKGSTCQCRRCAFNPWARKIPWRRKRKPTPVFLPGESHGQRSLVGYSPWGCRVGHDWATSPHLTLYIVVYICQSQPPHSSLPQLPFWCPYILDALSVCSPSVCSLCLCLYLCFANKLICTIFLDFTYKQYYTIFVFLFLTYFTLYDNFWVHSCLCQWHNFVSF